MLSFLARPAAYFARSGFLGSASLISATKARHQPLPAASRHPQTLLRARAISTQPSVTNANGVRSTIPSTTSPEAAKEEGKVPVKADEDDEDRGYLAFTKASLFKLTLPLQPPSSDPSSPTSKASSAYSLVQQARRAAKEREETRREAAQSSVEETEAWEKRADMGQSVSQVDPISRDEQKTSASSTDTNRKGSKATEATSDSSKASKRLGLHGPEMGEPADDPAAEFDARAPAHSVVFLLHSGQPLSYVASLIEAEGPGFGEDGTVAARNISFHSRRHDTKRWSPATAIGDFLRDSAKIGSFVIRLTPPKSKEEKPSSAASDFEPRNIFVSVPSFEDRTRYLRSTLYAKTYEIERMAKLKGECDALARVGTRRFAIGGAAILGAWWVAVAYGTFFTEYSWDLLEPVTYLTGLGVLMCGYVWFLVHNREVSYRAVLSETTTRRQQKLYIEKGFNLGRYEDLIDECKELRKHIKRVAEDYDLEWEQGKGSSGHNKRALDIVRKREAQDQAPKVIKTESEEEEHEGQEGVPGSDEEEQKKKEESGSK